MSDFKPTVPSATSPNTEEKSVGSSSSIDMLLLTYILMALGMMLPFFAIGAVILAYVSRGDAIGTWRESHYTWLIRTFWIGLVVGVVATITMVILVGYLVLFALAVWAIIRLAKGWMAYNRQQQLDQPEDWLFG